MADAAWALTRQLSPREHVRVAALEHDHGSYSNAYSSTAAIDDHRPAGPWAMYLADGRGYRFVCFDLDASKGNAAHDAGRLSLWLDEKVPVRHRSRQEAHGRGRLRRRVRHHDPRDHR